MIKQYDMKFGDSFLLNENSKNPYLIDFGSKAGYISKNIKLRYDKVIEDLLAIGSERVTFLLTHFHEDHYLGILYMMNTLEQREIEFKFKKILVPDIRNINALSSIISLLFHKAFLESILLGRKKTSCFSNLYKVSKFFLKHGYNLKFVSRGKNIDNIQILWPLKKYRKHHFYDSLSFIKNINNFNQENEEYMSFINNIIKYNERENINMHIQECANAWYQMWLFNDEIEYVNKFIKLDTIINDLLDYNKFSKKMINDEFKESLHDAIRKSHRYNIVFHNKEDSNQKNYLFTGDIEKNNMLKIFDNTIEPSIELHEVYSYVKVPHHGTQRYFFDFSAKINNETILLISNGKVKNWKIYSGYYDRYSDNEHICSNCNHCETFIANAKSCKCKKYKVIYPGFSISIS